VKYERRLRTLASRAGLCHVHMRTRLICVTCEARRGSPAWDGTDDELEELCALIESQEPYYAKIPAAGVCPLVGCGGKLFCDTCYTAAAARIVLPDDLYTPAERRRYAELIRYLQHKDITIGSHNAVREATAHVGNPTSGAGSPRLRHD
jgi:hypothetical protein